MMTRRFLTIHFMDGTKLSASFPQQLDNPAMMASKVQKALDANELAFEADGELIIIPVANVKYAHLRPAPEKLPDSVVTGARLEFE